MSKKRPYGTIEMLLRMAPFLVIGLLLTGIFPPLGIVVLAVGFWFAGF